MYEEDKREFLCIIDKIRKMKNFEKIADSDISFSEMILMDRIDQKDGKYTVSSLSDEIGTTKAAISKAISILELKGLVERQTDPEDKRVTHIKISDNGRKKYEIAKTRMSNITNCIVEKLGKDEARQFIQTAKKIHDILHERIKTEIENDE